MNLQDFCHKDESRPDLMAPLSRGAFTYATDGRILIRVPLIDSIPDNPSAPKSLVETMGAFDESECVTELPEIPPKEMETCSYCHEGRDEEGCDCDMCDGSYAWEKRIPVRIGDRDIASNYLRLISTLPNVRVSNVGDRYSPMSFSFDGGCGLLMPMRTVREGEQIHTLRRK